MRLFCGGSYEVVAGGAELLRLCLFAESEDEGQRLRRLDGDFDDHPVPLGPHELQTTAEQVLALLHFQGEEGVGAVRPPRGEEFVGVVGILLHLWTVRLLRHTHVTEVRLEQRLHGVQPTQCQLVVLPLPEEVRGEVNHCDCGYDCLQGVRVLLRPHWERRRHDRPSGDFREVFVFPDFRPGDDSKQQTGDSQSRSHFTYHRAKIATAAGGVGRTGRGRGIAAGLRRPRAGW